MASRENGKVFRAALSSLASGPLRYRRSVSGARSKWWSEGGDLSCQSDVIDLLVALGYAKVSQWWDDGHLIRRADEVRITPAGRKQAREYAKAV